MPVPALEQSRRSVSQYIRGNVEIPNINLAQTSTASLIDDILIPSLTHLPTAEVDNQIMGKVVHLMDRWQEEHQLQPNERDLFTALAYHTPTVTVEVKPEQGQENIITTLLAHAAPIQTLLGALTVINPAQMIETTEWKDQHLLASIRLARASAKRINFAVQYEDVPIIEDAQDFLIGERIASALLKTYETAGEETAQIRGDIASSTLLITPPEVEIQSDYDPNILIWALYSPSNRSVKRASEGLAKRLDTSDDGSAVYQILRNLPMDRVHYYIWFNLNNLALHKMTQPQSLKGMFDLLISRITSEDAIIDNCHIRLAENVYWSIGQILFTADRNPQELITPQQVDTLITAAPRFHPTEADEFIHPDQIVHVINAINTIASMLSTIYQEE